MLLSSSFAAFGFFFVNVFHFVLLRLVVFFLFLWVAYTAGWFHRFVLWIAQNEARKILNNTTVTIGSLQTDIIRGHFWASNVVIHSPQQAIWQWEAPLLARIGKVYVEVNLMQFLFFLWFFQEETPLELYTVKLSDIQVFLERKYNVYNFFLLDPHVILPEPIATTTTFRSEESNSCSPSPTTSNATTAADTARSKQADEAYVSLESNSPSELGPGSDSPKMVEEEQAQQVVEEMLSAVRRATQEGDNWHGALMSHYRQTLTDQLKALTQKKKSVAMQEGVNLIKQMTANITENTATAQQVVLPARRALPNERIVYGRVGRVVINELRIFHCLHEAQWNKPIAIKKLAIRSSEFCPPTSAKDQHGPAIYQTLNVCLEVVWKRILAEIAKSNTGRFFQTAIGEAADVFFSKKKIQEK